MGLKMKKWLTNSQFELREVRALRQSPSRCLQALVGERAKPNAADTGMAPPYGLRHRCNLTSVSKVCDTAPISLVLASHWIQRIIGSACQIAFHPDWQIDNGFFQRPVMARTQILVEAQGLRHSADIPCSGIPLDSTNYRKCVSNCLSSWLANRQWFFSKASHGAYSNPGGGPRLFFRRA